MGFKRFFKELKKKLRSRRLLTLGLWLMLIGAVALASILWTEGGKATETFSQLIRSATPGNKLIVEVEHRYVCGHTVDQRGSMSYDNVMEIQEEHPDWELAINGNKALFIEYIDDLSPKCKDSVYFGIDDDGNLSLFEGPPMQRKVIRTFFQLNIEHIESSLPTSTMQSLIDGIRIRDYAEYNSVLSTFSDLALEEEETEKAISPG